MVAIGSVQQLYVKRIASGKMKRIERIDRIELLQTFVRIVESGSLSAAARQLDTTQATVSRRLKLLENLLGAKLLLRTTHAMKLTEDGERCYDHARNVAGTWHALEDELSGDARVSGLLRVRAPHAFGQDQLMVPLLSFLARWPGLSIEWMLNDKSPDFIAENIDCAIHVGEVSHPDTVAVLLAEVPRIVVAAPSILANRVPVTQVSDLGYLPWIAISTFYQHEITLSQGAALHQQVAISPRLFTDSLYAARKAALAGLGVMIISAWAVEADLQAGTLIQLLPQWQARPLPVWLLYPWASYYPARLRHFLDMMKTVMPALAGMQASDRKHQ